MAYAWLGGGTANVVHFPTPTRRNGGRADAGNRGDLYLDANDPCGGPWGHDDRDDLSDTHMVPECNDGRPRCGNLSSHLSHVDVDADSPFNRRRRNGPRSGDGLYLDAS